MVSNTTTIIILLCLTSVGCTSIHNSLGEDALYAGRYEEAIKHYENALRTDPKDPEARLFLGIALYEYGNYNESIKNLLLFEEIDLNNPAAHYELGLSYKAIGNYKESIKRFLRANEILNHEDCLIHIAHIYFLMEKINISRKYIEKARKINPDIKTTLMKTRYKDKEVVYFLSEEIGYVVDIIGASYNTQEEALEGLIEYLRHINNITNQSSQASS